MIWEIWKANNRCYWSIDMNEGKQPYLVTYSWIDSIDHMIKTSGWSIKARSISIYQCYMLCNYMYMFLITCSWMCQMRNLIRYWSIQTPVTSVPFGVSCRSRCWGTTQFVGSIPVVQGCNCIHNIITLKGKGLLKLPPKLEREGGHHWSQKKILANLHLWGCSRKPKLVMAQTGIYVEISFVWTHTWSLAPVIISQWECVPVIIDQW